MRKKEIYWLVGTIGLVLILTLTLFGLDGFKTDSTLDINIHDTYFVIANFHFVTLLFVFTFFVVYLLRTIRRNFKNTTANFILIMVTILLVLIIGKTIGMLDFFSLPSDDGTYVQDNNPVGQIMRILSKILFGFQIGLLCLLAYCGFKTGRNYNSEEKH
ncbi:hypothetical protein Q2T41_06880 [Maribacter confluentis]|uniref:Uncharacterized protein n=1 Tax=Maribacter confluentis TaxID=1656093 RepID=A0ABT8RN84_9FLAO|nr:hypothetical protein [Maribacter confluentis]MDO1512377.1 hypothetical protein [Maribacter confluentis]